MTSHKAAYPRGSDWRTSNLVCNEDPETFLFGKLDHSYGRLVTSETFTDELNFNEHIIGIHGYI